MAGEGLYMRFQVPEYAQKQGWVQDFDDTQWGGKGSKWSLTPDGYREQRQFNSTGADEDVNRYRQMGADAANRQAYELDYSGANTNLNQAEGHYGNAARTVGLGFQDRARADQARGEQAKALDLQYGAATGEAPSRAELLGRSLIDQSLKAQVAGAGSARGGPLAQMAAQNRVRQGAAEAQQQGMNQLSALRADEMERARGAYMQGASGMRGQDYQGVQSALGMASGYGAVGQGVAGVGAQRAGMAQAQGAMEMNQRQLNQAGQMGYEGMSWDTRNAQLQANMGTAANAQQADQFKKTQQMARDQQQMQMGAALAGGAADMATAGITKSDMRAKNPVPLLLDVGGKKPKAAAPSFLSQYMDSQSAQRSNEHARDEHEERMNDMELDDDGREISPGEPRYGAQVLPHQDIERQDPYIRTPGGIQREDPYGSGQTFLSDERAKQAAFQQGVLYGESTYAGKPDPLPDYMRPKQAGAGGGEFVRTGKNLAGAQPGGPVGGGAKPLEIEHTRTAPRIDPKAHGEQPPPSTPPPTADVGARSVERGRPSPVRGPQPGDKGGPLAQLQQDANRRGAGFAYTYKPQHTPSEQSPGELNYGPSANELERNPLTATAIRQTPDGMRAIDVNKLVKNNTSSIASLQDQIDQLRGGRYG